HYESFTLDAYGNQTSHTTTSYDGVGGLLRRDVEKVYFTYDDTAIANWLLSQLDPSRPSTRSSSTSTETTTRTIKFTPDTTHGGVAEIEIEPSGGGDTYLHRWFERDTAGRLTSVREQDSYGAPITSYFRYGSDNADGVYVTRFDDAKGRATHVWRHPGLGLVVETDDPNNLAATRSYDTFGRLLQDTAETGALTTLTYQDATG